MIKEEKAAQAAEAKKAAQADENLIQMTKDGETIDVHPSCVNDHKRLGWKLQE